MLLFISALKNTLIIQLIIALIMIIYQFLKFLLE